MCTRYFALPITITKGSSLLLQARLFGKSSQAFIFSGYVPGQFDPGKDSMDITVLVVNTSFAAVQRRWLWNRRQVICNFNRCGWRVLNPLRPRRALALQNRTSLPVFCGPAFPGDRRNIPHARSTSRLPRQRRRKLQLQPSSEAVHRSQAGHYMHVTYHML